MVASMKDLCRRHDAGNLIEHADEILDGLLGTFGGDLGLFLFEVVRGSRVVLVKDACR